MQFNTKGPAKWFLLAGFAIVIISFVFFYGYSASEGNMESIVVAKIDGNPIFMSEFKNVYQNLQERAREESKSADQEALNEYIQNEALQYLVQRHFLMNMAKKYKIEPSNQEILNAIAGRKEFRNEDGKFDSQKFIENYKRLPPYYKKMMEQEAEGELSLSLLEIRVNDAAKLTDNEIRQNFETFNTKVKIAYIYDEAAAAQSNSLLQIPSTGNNRVDKVFELVKAGHEFFSTAQSLGLVPQTTEYFYFGGPILKAGTTNQNVSSLQQSLEVYQKAFSMKRGQLSDVITAGKGRCMVVVIDRKEPNWGDFYKQAGSIKYQSQAQKMNSFYQQWFSTAFKDARYQSNLDRLFRKSKKDQ